MICILDGFTYDRISASFTDAKTRLAWLRKGDTHNGTFFPQPYTQLAKVLTEMGHDREARKVLVAREQRLNVETRTSIKVIPNGDVDVAFRSLWWDGAIFLHWLWDRLLYRVVRYGYAPQHALVAMLACVLPAALFYAMAYTAGAMVPNSDVILTSPGWFWSMLFAPDTPTLVWDHSATARHYETFYSLAYAFDVFVPLVDMGQDSAWSASTVSWLGWTARIGTMVLEVVGWVVTALGAAAITGIIQRDRG